MKKIFKGILIVLGIIFLGIGIIGLIIPIMPTMPFLIISGLCFINSSQKLYHKVIKIKYFGKHVQNYIEKREITIQFKISSLLFIWIPSLVTIIFIVKRWDLRVLAVSIALLITFHILSLKTIR